MREDLEHISVYLKGDELISTHGSVLETFSSLQKQKTPKKWTKKSFYTNKSNSLEDFFRCFLHKYETLKEIVYRMKCEVPPVIPLQKLFDPIHFLTSILWQYSVKNSVSIFNLEIELHPYKIPPTRTNKGNDIYVTGFYVKGGRISSRTFLDEEYSREYYNKLPGFRIKIVHRERTHMLMVIHSFYSITNTYLYPGR